MEFVFLSSLMFVRMEILYQAKKDSQAQAL